VLVGGGAAGLRREVQGNRGLAGGSAEGLRSRVSYQAARQGHRRRGVAWVGGGGGGGAPSMCLRSASLPRSP
jgi:hypothetical protein